MSDFKYDEGDGLVNDLANRGVRVLTRRVHKNAGNQYFVYEFESADEYWIHEDNLIDMTINEEATAKLHAAAEALAESKEAPAGQDPVNHPSHYTQFPVEVIELTRHLDFCSGNVVKYVCRASFKGKELEDLKKARWYLEDRIKQLESETVGAT